MGKKVLGKGLSALLNIQDLESKNIDVLDLPIDQIYPNASQPRKNFNEEKLLELAKSIEQNGMIQPIIVTRKLDKYEIIVGERRWRACKILKHLTIPSIVKEVTNHKQLKLALLENIQREDLNAIEEAKAYRELIHQFNLTQEELSNRLGKSRSHITNLLRLLKLPNDIQNEIIAQQLSEGHARTLLGLKDFLKDCLIDIKNLVIDKKISVRNLESFIKILNSSFENIDEFKKKLSIHRDIAMMLEYTYKTHFENHSKSLDTTYPSIEKKVKPLKEISSIDITKAKVLANQMSKNLQIDININININKSKKNGILEIQFLNMEELDRIIQFLVKKTI